VTESLRDVSIRARPWVPGVDTVAGAERSVASSCRRGGRVARATSARAARPRSAYAQEHLLRDSWQLRPHTRNLQTAQNLIAELKKAH